MKHFPNTPKLARITTFALAMFVGAGLAHEARAADDSARSAASDAKPAAVAGELIGGFEGKSVDNKQYGTLVPALANEAGWGWSKTSDQRQGGHSTAEISLVHPGASGSKGALHVQGEINKGFIAPWAGAIWFPGAEPMQLADLSAKQELVFQTRGAPGTYTIMLMSGSAQSIPQFADFEVTEAWQEVHIPLASKFPGADYKRVFFIAFCGGNWGKFQFDLDQVTLR